MSTAYSRKASEMAIANGKAPTSTEVIVEIFDEALRSSAAFATLDLSTLPTSNPGSGKPWLNGGVLQVGV